MKEFIKLLSCIFDFLVSFFSDPFVLLRTPASLTDTTSYDWNTEAVRIVTTCSSVRGDNMRTACLIAIHCCSGNSSLSISYP